MNQEEMNLIIARIHIVTLLWFTGFAFAMFIEAY